MRYLNFLLLTFSSLIISCTPTNKRIQGTSDATEPKSTQEDYAKSERREIIDGCEGESCDCYAGYKYKDGKIQSRLPLQVIHEFKLYKSMSKDSELLGSFKKGSRATPLGQKILYVEPGLYVVEDPGDHKIFNAGDQLSRMLYKGEGMVEVSRGEEKLTYDATYLEPYLKPLKLKTVRETKIEKWLLVQVGELNGYTQAHPFEGCH